MEYIHQSSADRGGWRPAIRSLIIVACFLIPLGLLVATLKAVNAAVVVQRAPTAWIDGTVFGPGFELIPESTHVRLYKLYPNGACCEYNDALVMAFAGTGSFSIPTEPLAPYLPGTFYIQSEAENMSPWERSVPQPIYITSTNIAYVSPAIRLTYPSFDGMVYTPDFQPVMQYGDVKVFWPGLIGMFPAAHGRYDAGVSYKVGGVPAGTFILQAMPPADSIYDASEPVTVTVIDGSQYSPGGTQIMPPVLLTDPDVMGLVLYPGPLWTPATWISESGMIIGSARVNLHQMDPVNVRNRITASSGQYGFGFNHAGQQYQLWAEPSGVMAITYTNSIPVSFTYTGITITQNLTLTYPSVQGKVFDPEGILVSQCVSVRLIDLAFHHVAVEDEYCGGTDELFRLGGVPDGFYYLDATTPAGAPYLTPSIVYITVTHGSQYDPLGIQYQNLQFRTAPLTVYVTNGSRAEVRVWNDFGFVARQEITPPGPALFDGLSANTTYWVQAWPLGADIPEWANSLQVPIEITGIGQIVNLAFQPPNVTGEIFDPQYGPLPAANHYGVPTYPATVLVMPVGAGDPMIGPTNDAGLFSLNLPAGSYRLEAYPNASNGITLTRSGSITFTVTAPATILPLDPLRLTYPSIRGRVLDPFGQPILTMVDLWSANLDYFDNGSSSLGPGGQYFQFGAMPDGLNYVQAQPPESNPFHYGSSEIYTFTVLPDSQYVFTATQTHSLTLTTANFIGRLEYPPTFSDHFGNPVPEVDVLLRDASSSFLDWAVTDFDGNFYFSGLQPGSYQIVFYLPPELSLDWEAPFGYDNEFTLVTTTQQINRVFTLDYASQTKWLSGTVTFEGGEPVIDARVVAYHQASSQWKTILTDISGNYSMPLGPGRWFVWIEPAVASANWYFNQSWGQWIDYTLPPQINEPQFAHFTVAPAIFYRVIGTVLDPALAPPPLGSTTIHLCTDNGTCFAGPGDNTGGFSIDVLPGSYHVWVQVDSTTGLLPPLDNGFIINVTSDTSLDPIILRAQASRSAQVSGQVVNIATGFGVPGAVIEAWTDSGDWVTATTDTAGYYNLYLAPGFWHGSLWLSEAQAQNWFVLPPQVKEGYVGEGEIVTDVNFVVRYRDAQIQGFVSDDLGGLVTDTVAVAYAAMCDTIDCWMVDVGMVMGGYFDLHVPGNVTYTVGVWLPGNDYLPGDPVSVPVALGQTVQNLQLTVIPARTRIHGILVDPEQGPVQINAAVFASDGQHWAEDYLWPEKDPYEFDLRIPTPVTNTHWAVGLWVDPATGYVAAPDMPYDVEVGAGITNTEPITLYVRRLDATITGTITLDGNPAPYTWVYARGIEDTTGEGLTFEGISSPDGTFTITVASGSYRVGAYLPANLSADYFAPSPVIWTTAANNPVSLAFTPKGEIEISGSLAILPTGAITDTAVIHVFGASELGYVEVTGTLAGGYHLSAAPNTRWTLWAAYEDAATDTYYLSQITSVEVETTTVTGINLALAGASDALPDAQCWVFDSSQLMRLNLPGSGGQPGPVVTIPAGAFPVDGQVSVCATPRVAVPGGNDLIGFAYELEARDSQGNLITEDFNKKVRISFYVDPGQLPPGVDLASLQVVFFSTSRQEWVALVDLYIDPVTGLVTGTTQHFTKFGVRTGFAGEEEGYYLYLPVVVRDTGSR